MKNLKIELVFLLFIFTFAFILNSCGKDPEVITNTVIEVDTVFVTQHDTVFTTLTDTVTLTQFINDTATTFILVRHAETTGIGSDPGLSTAGQTRSDELRRIMDNVSLAAVFSTNFNRTMQTAQVTADDKMLTVDIYDPFNLNQFVDNTLEEYHTEKVLVVGHSNTTPSLLNVLVGANIYSDLPESEYDNLYVVTVFEKGRAEVVHLKYGE